MADTSTVVKLVPKPAIKSEGCVATLENMLALAKNGVLTGVAVAGVVIFPTRFMHGRGVRPIR